MNKKRITSKNQKIKLDSDKLINKLNKQKQEVKFLNFKTTAEISVPKNISDQIIGQDEALQIVKKASKQRRNILFIGEPGTGKSLLGQALAEQLPVTKL